MTNTWLRLWHDMPTDPKFRVIAKRSGRPLSEVLAVFVLMLTNASSSVTRGTLDNWSDEDAAAAIDCDPEHVASIRTAMQGKTLDGDELTGWNKRQPKRDDDSSDRVKAFRERQRTQRNADVTPCNAAKRKETLDTDTEEIREDKIDLPTVGLRASAQVSAPAEPDRPTEPDFIECKKAFNGSTDAMLAEIVTAMGAYGDRAGASQWLATTLRTNGQDATAQAFQMLATARAEGKPIARVLPWWAKTAASLKASGGTKPKTEFVDRAAAKRAADRAYLESIGAM